VAIEEYRRSQKNWVSVDHALKIVLDRYNDVDVIAMVASYIKRGRLTLPLDTEAPERHAQQATTLR
jgi:hypothetical protein